jgi:hypothetical protein
MAAIHYTVLQGLPTYLRPTEHDFRLLSTLVKTKTPMFASDYMLCFVNYMRKK